MPENVGALPLASADETFPLPSFDQLQKHGQIQNSVTVYFPPVYFSQIIQ